MTLESERLEGTIGENTDVNLFDKEKNPLLSVESLSSLSPSSSPLGGHFLLELQDLPVESWEDIPSADLLPNNSSDIAEANIFGKEGLSLFDTTYANIDDEL
jgi:hypothetical protein